MGRFALALVGLWAGWCALAFAEPARSDGKSAKSLQLAQQPNVEVRPLEDKNTGQAPFRIRQSAPEKKAASQPSAPAPAEKPTEPAAPVTQESPKPSTQKTANAATASDIANTVRRPTQTGETSGNAVAAFWFVLPEK